MNRDIRREAAIMTAVWAAASTAGMLLYQAGLISFVLVHTASEIVSVLAAAALTMLAWTGRRYLDNGALRLLGSAYLFVGFLDLLHTLSYGGINLFPGHNESLAEHLWLAARVIQAGALLAAPSFTNHRIGMGKAIGIFGGATALLLLAIFYYPPLSRGELASISIEFIGVAEIIIISAFGLALIRFNGRRNQFEERVFTWLFGSIVVTILTELLITITPGTEDTSDLLGNFMKVGAYYLIYKAVIETGFTHPMEVLFTDLQQNRLTLQHERDFISGVLDTANAMILVMDAEGRIVRTNRALAQLTRNIPEEVEGRYIWETNIFPGGQDDVRRLFLERLSSRPSNNFEQQVLSSAGEMIEATWTTGMQYSASGAPRFIIAAGIDISDRKKVENELRYLSTHDPLTGLYNRAYFEAEMLRLADSDEFPLSIVVADLDGLKLVNDTDGHIMGDKLIQRAAHILRSAFRGEDIIARIGGDEYAVLLPRADALIASRGAQRVTSILSAYNQINQEHPLGLSVGYATCTAGYQLMEAFKQADTAMYAQKSKTKDEVGGN